MATFRNMYGQVDHALAAAGFKVTPMGGGLEAWRRDMASGHYALITCGEDGTSLYAKPDATEWLAGFYGPDHSDTLQEASGVTLSAAIEAAEVWALRTAGCNT